MLNRSDLLRSVILEAGRFAHRLYQSRSSLEIEHKGIQNFVSKADKDTEHLIRQTLQKHFPDDAVLGEEYGLTNADRPNGYVWIIDPIDGTTNFLCGVPQWCVSIALAKDSEICLGAVYDPNSNELFFAEAGKGSFVNDEPVSLRNDLSLQNAGFALGYKIGVSKQAYVANVERILEKNGVIFRNGSGALMCVYAGCSRLSGFYEEHINSWDVAAAFIFCQEAGMYTSDYYTLDALLNGNRILVCPPALAEEVKTVLQWKD